MKQLLTVDYQAIRQGPIKDAVRTQEKKEKGLTEPSLTPQQLQRLAEYEMQKKLQEEYQIVQTVDDSKKIEGLAVPISAPIPSNKD